MMTNDGSTNELDNDNNVDDDGNGTPGSMDNPDDEDDYDPALVSITQSFDLAIQKVLTNPGSVMPGDNVDFTITVYNQGLIRSN